MNSPPAKITAKQIISSGIYILMAPLLQFILSGDWLWPEGWIFSVWIVTLSVTVMVYLLRKDPALLMERYQKPGAGNQKSWDRIVIYLIIIGFWSWMIVMPLDAKRFHWSPNFPLFLKILGGLGLINSFVFMFRSFVDNTFLSPLVRIQSERKHQVVSTGAYAIVRHPMYLGAISMFLGTPLLLGSICGVVLGALLSLLLMARSVGEEKMLTGELEGYADYQKKVKYRLVPYVW